MIFAKGNIRRLHRYCLLVVCTLDFEGSKSEPLSKKLRAGIGRFGDPFSVPVWSSFCKMRTKTMVLQIRPGKAPLGRYYVVGSADEVRRFAPLPRTVYLVK